MPYLRERRVIRPGALVAAFAALLVALVAALTPVAAVASSGLPPSITLQPETPVRGDSVGVAGLDFPPGSSVELHLISISGSLPMGTLRADKRGRFRHSMSIPADLSEGVWELRASGPGDAVAVRLFRPVDPTRSIPEEEAAGTRARSAAGEGHPAANASTNGVGGSDLLVLLIVAALVAAVGGAAAVGWRTVRRGDRQPGMPAGDDPIWTGSGQEQIR